MIVPFDELRKHEFSLSDIKVIFQNPQYSFLVQKNRQCNGFLYILEGSCRYEFEGGEFSLSEGGVTYLPLGSRHTFTITSESISFYRIDFTVSIGDEVVLFSDRPIKITDKAPTECVEAVTSLEKDFGIDEDSVARMQKLCSVFSCLQKKNVSHNAKRLMPAVKYLQENIAVGVGCATLAELCFLSTSRFYELFGAEFGMTPLEYRDRMLIKRASAMLTAGDVSVREVALAVGFENAAYFSRFFKKHTGVAPSEYAKI